MKPLVLAALLGATALPALAQEVTLRMSSWLPPSHPIVAEMMIPWAAELEEATEGRVTVQILDAPLGPPPAHFDLAQTGAADLTYSVHGYTPGRFTLTQIGELPFLTPDATSASVAYQRVHDEMLADANEHAGTKVIGVFLHGPGMLWMNGREAGDPAAIEGAKVRIPGAIPNQLASNLGMVPLQSSATQVFELLSGGVADGAMFPAESPPFFRLTDNLTTGMSTEGGLYNVSFFFVMNQGAYDRLSDEDKAALDALSGESFARRAGAAWDAADAAAMDAMEGIAVTEASPEMRGLLEEAADPIYAQVKADVDAKGVDFDAALEMFRSVAEEVAAE